VIAKCSQCGNYFDMGMEGTACPHDHVFHVKEPTPPATPAEMPECVRRLVDYILVGANDDPVLKRCEKYAAAVRDHYAKGGQ